MPQHRKPKHSPKVLVAAIGVAFTVSGVAFAAEVGQQKTRVASDPVTVAGSSAPSSSAPEDHVEREVRPSRSASARRADLRRKADERRARRKPAPVRPSLTETPETTPLPSPETDSPAPEPTVRQQTQTATPTTTPSSGAGILGGTNTARADAGVPALGTSACLTRMAQRHAERLAAAGTLYHQELSAVVGSCGMSTAGENVAMNYTRPSDMVGQWLDSPGHRENMLNRGFRLIGVGVAKARDGAWYGVQVFGAR